MTWGGLGGLTLENQPIFLTNLGQNRGSDTQGLTLIDGKAIFQTNPNKENEDYPGDFSNVCGFVQLLNGSWIGFVGKINMFLTYLFF